MKTLLLCPVLALGLLAAGCAPGAGAAAPAAGPAASPAPAATAPPAGAGAPAPPSSAAAAPAPAAAPTALPPMARQTIQWGYNPILAGGATYIAQERGYFAEQGFDVEFVSFDSGALMIAPAAAGQLDAFTAVASPSTFNAIARGIPLKGVALQSYSETTLMVRKDLVDSGQVRALGDLRGRRVSFNVEGSPVDYQLRLMFLQQGIGLNELDVVRIPNPDLMPALANAAVEAGVSSDPWPVLIENRGIGVRFLNSADVIGRQPSGIVTVGPSMLARGDEANTRLMVAMLKGLRDFVGSIKDSRVTDPQVLEILSKWTRLPADVIAQSPAPGADPDGKPDIENFIGQQDFWEREGMLTGKANLREFFDLKYLDAALARLR